jgi:protein-disulfide isomerase
MGYIWLTLAAFCLALPALPARAEEGPAPTAEDHVLGKPDAPITIIEYASFTCPHCAAFDRETLPKVRANWVETGKARYIFREYPLNGLDLRAAMLARCAPGERYFAFVDTLYQTQDSWSRASDPLAALGQMGKLGGVSSDQFQACMKDEKLGDAIAAGRLAAEKSYHVESTPTFFINGTRMEPNGAQPYDVFDKILTAAQPKS